MKRQSQLLSCALVALFALAIAPAAWGAPFDAPPESNPNITWQTSFPYQRNILLDFNVDPRGPAGSGIPGADYEGYDDPVLWDSDYVEFTGDVTWNAALGAVGIFDATAASSGTIVVHIDNWVRDWPVKHLYDEFVFKFEGAAGSIYQQSLGLPAGYAEGEYWGDASFPFTAGVDEWVHYWTEIERNPPWENKIISMSIGAGGSVYVKSLHVATECVPEPTSLALLAVGGLVLVFLRRKR